MISIVWSRVDKFVIVDRFVLPVRSIFEALTTNDGTGVLRQKIRRESEDKFILASSIINKSLAHTKYF